MNKGKSTTAAPIRTAETKDIFCIGGTNYKDVVKMRPFQPQFNFKTMGSHTTPTVKPSSKKG